MSINNTNYGTSSLNNNSGNNNSAFGAYAAYNNLDASCNTAVGSNSLFYNTTGNYNTSLGAGSLCNNNVGSLNTAIGSSALEGLVENQSVGNKNTAVGAQALYSNAGDYNTSIGTYAARDVSGNYNTFLGANTTFNNISNTYEYSTALGYGAAISSSYQIMMGDPSSNIVIPGLISAPGGITGATGSFSNLYVSGPSNQVGLISAPGGITGATGSFTNLYVSGPSKQVGLISAPGGITGATGSFTNINISGTTTFNGIINAPGGITGATGSFSNLYVSGPSKQVGLISAPGGITGPTGSFSNLYVSGPSNQVGLISAPGGITGATGSFSNLYIGPTGGFIKFSDGSIQYSAIETLESVLIAGNTANQNNILEVGNLECHTINNLPVDNQDLFSVLSKGTVGGGKNMSALGTVTADKFIETGRDSYFEYILSQTYTVVNSNPFQILIDGGTLTLDKGSYLFNFKVNFTTSSSVNNYTLQLLLDGVLVTDSLISTAGGLTAASLIINSHPITITDPSGVVSLQGVLSTGPYATSLVIPASTSYFSYLEIYKDVVPVPPPFTFNTGAPSITTQNGNQYTYTFYVGSCTLTPNYNITIDELFIVGGGQNGQSAVSETQCGGGNGGGVRLYSISTSVGTTNPFNFNVGAGGGYVTTTVVTGIPALTLDSSGGSVALGAQGNGVTGGTGTLYDGLYYGGGGGGGGFNPFTGYTYIEYEGGKGGLGCGGGGGIFSRYVVVVGGQSNALGNGVNTGGDNGTSDSYTSTNGGSSQYGGGGGCGNQNSSGSGGNGMINGGLGGAGANNGAGGGGAGGGNSGGGGGGGSAEQGIYGSGGGGGSGIIIMKFTTP